MNILILLSHIISFTGHISLLTAYKACVILRNNYFRAFKLHCSKCCYVIERFTWKVRTLILDTFKWPSIMKEYFPLSTDLKLNGFPSEIAIEKCSNSFLMIYHCKLINPKGTVASDIICEKNHTYECSCSQLFHVLKYALEQVDSYVNDDISFLCSLKV